MRPPHSRAGDGDRATDPCPERAAPAWVDGAEPAPRPSSRLPDLDGRSLLPDGPRSSTEVGGADVANSAHSRACSTPRAYSRPVAGGPEMIASAGASSGTIAPKPMGAAAAPVRGPGPHPVNQHNAA